MLKPVIILILSLSLSTQVVGQEPELSESEIAAISERGITGEERTLKSQGCNLWDEMSETIVFSSGIQAWVVELPNLQFLLQQTISRNNKNREQFDLSAFPPLPNGGIGGKDICTTARLYVGSNAQEQQGTVQFIGLLLRWNLNLQQDYPNTFVTIDERNQLRITNEGRYAAIGINDDNQEAALVNIVANSSIVDTQKHFFRIGNVLLVPLK